MSKHPKKARLIKIIPKDRYFIKDSYNEETRIGDIVTIDQGTQSPDGKPMYLVNYANNDGIILYEALVYEEELGSDLE